MEKILFKLTVILTLLCVMSASVSALEENISKSSSEKDTKTEALVLPEKYRTMRVTLPKSDLYLNGLYVKELLAELSKETGLKLSIDNDFRVEERRIKFMAEDALLPSVMYSIADVTKFVWVVKGEDTYVLTYNEYIRPLVDSLKIKSLAAAHR